jgi:hypothetical protein
MSSGINSCISCRSISTDVTYDAINKRLERRLFQLFPDKLPVVLDLLILQDKHNIRNAFALAAKQARKAHQRIAFLLVSKARTNKLYIFRQCTYIVYVHTI